MWVSRFPDIICNMNRDMYLGTHSHHTMQCNCQIYVEDFQMEYAVFNVA
jgi:hypothetical protein